MWYYLIYYYDGFKVDPPTFTHLKIYSMCHNNEMVSNILHGLVYFTGNRNAPSMFFSVCLSQNQISRQIGEVDKLLLFHYKMYIMLHIALRIPGFFLQNIFTTKNVLLF